MKHMLTSFLLAGTVSASGQWLNDNLIAHFPLDGSPVDIVGGLAPVVISGNPGFCTDRHGTTNGAACFDGASFWSYGDVLDMDTGDFSIALWVRIDTVRPTFTIAPGFFSEGSTLVGKGNSIFSSPYQAGYNVFTRNSGTPQIDVYGLTGDDSNDLVLMQGTIEQDEWVHLVLSRCGDHQLMFVNGVLTADSLTGASRNIDVNTVFCIGGMDRDPSTELDSEWLNGALDDVRVYKNRCLSQQEINVLADLTVGITEVAPRGERLQASPNPANTIVRFDFPEQVILTGSITVLNAIGQNILLRALEPVMVNGSIQRLTLDVSHLPKGAYFVTVPTEEGSLHGRFVKE